jgi:flagellar motor switch protein FliN/FliY
MAEQPPASGGVEDSSQNELDPSAVGSADSSGADPLPATAPVEIDAADPLAAVADQLNATPGLSSDDQAAIDELLKQATFDDPSSMAAAASVPPAGVASAGSPMAAAEPVPAPPTAAFDLPNFNQAIQDAAASSIDLLRDVDLNVKIELGRSRMLVEDVLKLGEGSVVELDKLAGDPVDVFVNDRLVARGEVLVLNDNFCVRINEIVSGVKEEGL